MLRPQPQVSAGLKLEYSQWSWLASATRPSESAV